MFTVTTTTNDGKTWSESYRTMVMAERVAAAEERWIMDPNEADKWGISRVVKVTRSWTAVGAQDCDYTTGMHGTLCDCQADQLQDREDGNRAWDW